MIIMKSYAEREKEALAEAETQVLQRYGLTRQGGESSQMEEYQRQQTAAGQRAMNAIEIMASKMQRITNRPVKTGKLNALIDGRTGKITRFIEN